MGTWGTALFSDDLASDVRDDYRDLVGEGLSGVQATDRLLLEWEDTLADDPEGASVFWLALAATQWRRGRLEGRVKKKALEIIGSGSDLERWAEEPILRKKREAVLENLHTQLNSTQPAQKRIRKSYKNTCEWDIGEVVSYRLLSGKLVLFSVTGFHTDKGGTSPIFEFLDWIGDDVPSEEKIRELGVRSKQFGNTQFMIGRLYEKELPRDRVHGLGIMLKPAQKPMGFTVFLWRNLDDGLKAAYGVS